jgi:hypothetical protein
MALSNVTFEAVSERDLRDLVDTGVPEGILYDYKLQTYGRADADVKEYLKDVSSFANTAGGHLIIGMDEASGLPTGLMPLSIPDPDQELQRLENLARDGVEPRIVGLRMKAVSLATGGVIIVVRIPKSWNPPHRVSARNTNRFYARNSAGAYELSVEELRVLFTSASSAIDRMRAFRAERLARIDSGEAITPLPVDRGRLVAHFVPLASFGLGDQIDLEKAYSLHSSLRPMGSMGLTPRFNFEGFANFSMGPDGLCSSYTQVFRNGIIEAVRIRMLAEREGGVLVIPSLAFDKYIFEVLPMYMTALRDLNVPPPITIMITLQGVRGARLGVKRDWFDDPPALDRAVLELPEVVVERYGTEEEYQKAVRPAFDALWNSAGYPCSRYFDSDDRWVGIPPG